MGLFDGLGELSHRGVVRKVSLSIGRGIDVLRPAVGLKPRGVPKPIGHLLTADERRVHRVSDQRILDLVFSARTAQIKDRERAGATVVPARGLFAGFIERSSIVDIFWLKSDAEPSFSRFEQNIEVLAQELALGLAQAEIIATFTNGTDQYVTAASPFGFPQPDSDESKPFIENVRHAGRRR